MKMNSIIAPDQLELDMSAERCQRRRQPRRAERAQWWFARMRQIVSLTPPWHPAPTGPAWQASLPIEN